MSLGLGTNRLRCTVRTHSPGGFRAGHALLGRVRVSAGGSICDVPFVVGVP